MRWRQSTRIQKPRTLIKQRIETVSFVIGHFRDWLREYKAVRNGVLKEEMENKMQNKFESIEMDIRKEKYEQVEMEIIAFESEDVITASGDSGDNDDILLPEM